MPTVTPAPICSYLDDTWPTPRRLRPLLALLLDLEYTPGTTEFLVAHAARWGTLECTGVIDPEHREMAEAALPMDEDWDSNYWDEHVYAPGPEVPR